MLDSIRLLLSNVKYIISCVLGFPSGQRGDTKMSCVMLRESESHT